MEYIAANIGAVLRQARQARNLSLDEAAALTGVSKAMLGQIERGESNPTVSTLWKISTGLKITLSALIGGTKDAYRVIRQQDLQPIYEADEKMTLFNIFPFDPLSGFEYLYIELKPGCCYQSPSHSGVQEEYIVVTQGLLELTINQQCFVLGKGASIRFKGSENHAYANPYAETAIFQNLMRY